MINRILNILASNLSLKIVSVVIAVVLWVIVLGSRNGEITKEIPLQVITAENIVPSNDIPQRIAFRLAGPTAFLRQIQDRRENPIRMDLTDKEPGVVPLRFYSDLIRLPVGVKVLSVSPATLLVRLESVRERKVPLQVELRGTPPEGYRITRTEVDPQMVTIKGPASRVASVSEVTTMPIDVADLRESIEHQIGVNLMDLRVEHVGEPPVVRIEVEADAANYRIRNVEVRVRSTFIAKVHPETVTVFVKTSPEELQNLDSSKVYATVNLRGKARGTYTENVEVSLPKGVTLVKVVPEQVEVTLGKR